MLEGLDEINWSQLHHAFGDANDVPNWIRALLCKDKQMRDNAIYELSENLQHQDTVYEASFYAVPFLLELLNSPHTPDKPAIAMLVADMGNNSGGPFDYELGSKTEEIYRKALANQGKALEVEADKGRKYAESIRQTIGKEIHLLYPYLLHEETYVRAVIAHALIAFPELSQEIIPRLEKALESETDIDIRQTIEDSIKILSETN